jgi:hypothetical protein
MTHPGDNPFSNSGWVTDDGLIDLIVSNGLQDDLHEQLDEQGKEMIQEVLAVFDECNVGRIVDSEEDIENRLQEERLALIREQIETDMLTTQEGAELFGSGQLHAAVELKSQLALIATRRMHNRILEMATILKIKFSHLTDEEKLIHIQDYVDEKRVFIIIMRDYYQLDMSGWPVAFDRATPGDACTDGIDWSEYEVQAAEEIELMKAKDLRESHELDDMISLIGVHDMQDDDEAVNYTIGLAFIQEIVDNIERLGEPNTRAQIGEMIWHIGPRFGLNAEKCKAIADYYDGGSYSSLN